MFNFRISSVRSLISLFKSLFMNVYLKLMLETMDGLDLVITLVTNLD